MSVTGIVVLQSHCKCTGDEHVSIYVNPGTCEDDFHVHHKHMEGGEEVPSTESECHECTSHTNDCGCNDVMASFHKLKDEVVQEKVRTDAKQPVKMIQPVLMVFLQPVHLTMPPGEDLDYREPPLAKTSLDILIQHHQLKIPDLA